MYPRADKDTPTRDNPVVTVRHMIDADGHCLGLHAILWCPGCQHAHGPTFRCPEHGGPPDGPVWDGDPHSDPFGFEPSLLVHGMRVCHSFVRNGEWQFLPDSHHSLAGQTVPLEPLPDWLVR